MCFDQLMKLLPARHPVDRLVAHLPATADVANSGGIEFDRFVGLGEQASATLSQLGHWSSFLCRDKALTLGPPRRVQKLGGYLRQVRQLERAYSLSSATGKEYRVKLGDAGHPAHQARDGRLGKSDGEQAGERIQPL